MIFQEILADHNPDVHNLQRVLTAPDLVDEFAKHWQYIQARINYFPIFHVASEILTDLTSDPDLVIGLRALAKTAQKVVSMRAALHHDLMGRVYHRLLAEAKYLGTYYTSIPAAALLLKVALRPNAWTIDWSDLDELRKFRAADIACGTGTLLMATSDAISDNYISASVAQGQKINLEEFHNILVESIIHGYDVLASALHLTASTLASRAPHVSFHRMNLTTMPLGGRDKQLGSIEFLQGGQVSAKMDLFGAAAPEQVTGEGMQTLASASLPSLDLCVINPPFTRSVGGNLLFGSLPDAERAELQKRLKKLVSRKDVLANSTAGLGSVFVAAADPYIKTDGRLALVLPKALLSGVAWRETRELINRKYRLEFLFASQDAERWNFSDSTDLSEVMLIAAKLRPGESVKDTPVVGVNLWRNPTTSFEALAIAQTLITQPAPDLLGQGALELAIGTQKVGEAISISANQLQAQETWLLPCAFAQADLIRAAYHLASGKLWLPAQGVVKSLPLCPLGELGDLGPDARDIHDGFKTSEKETAYPAFWGHDANEVTAFSLKPNKFLSPLPKPKPGRHLRKVEDLWPLSGRILIAERLRLNTQKLVAVRLPKNVLSSMWWSFSAEKGINQRAEKAFVLWLNSTLGFLQFISRRVETAGAWAKFKKPPLASMPVLDVRALNPKQLDALADAYDEFAHQELQPFPQMHNDPVRGAIDKSIARALKLPDVGVLREMLSREPVVGMKRI